MVHPIQQNSTTGSTELTGSAPPQSFEAIKILDSLIIKTVSSMRTPEIGGMCTQDTEAEATRKVLGVVQDIAQAVRIREEAQAAKMIMEEVRIDKEREETQAAINAEEARYRNAIAEAKKKGGNGFLELSDLDYKRFQYEKTGLWF